MSRAILSSGLAAVCCGLAFAAPLPKDDGKPALYVPVNVGAKRVLEVNGRDSGHEQVETVKSVVTKDGMTIVTIERQMDAEALPSDVFGASEKGLVRLGTDGKPLDPPHWVLRLPVRRGEKWEFREPGNAKLPACTNQYETSGEEAVEVPAGKFQAVRVNRKSIQGDGRVNMDLDLWIAPEVGVVKVKGKLGGMDYERVLKSFTPASKK